MATDIELYNKNCQIEEMQNKLKKLKDEMYNVNADISLKFVGMKTNPTLKDMEGINRIIGSWIKELKEILGD